MKIVFTNTSNSPINYGPKTASISIPDWYKNLESYLGGSKNPSGSGDTTATIKRCMPVFDAISAGYILHTQVDIFVSQRENNPWYEWPSLDPINFHPIEQAPNHPNRNGHNISYPKWINPWGIKTPPGYSTLFVQPFHRESIFTILPGIVDTDTYSAPVNFPFVLNDIKFEGLIPAGTPMVQLIPIKRDKWIMEIGKEKELKEIENKKILLRSKFFDSYKNIFRQSKEYK